MNLTRLVHSLIYLAFVLVVYLIVRRILKSIFGRAKGRKMTPSQAKRLQTIHEMLLSVARYVVLILVLLVVLANLGVNVTSLLAGLGIMTAVMGLAFQDLIKDVIAGVTIIIEGQFSVGDQVAVDGFQGTVINMGLKTTQIQASTGEVKIIANHNINSLVNYSKFDVTAQVEVSVPFNVSPGEVLKALSAVTRAKIAGATGPVSVGPIQDIEGYGVKYLLSCPCGTADSSAVQGEMMRKIIEVFQEKKIPVAVPVGGGDGQGQQK